MTHEDHLCWPISIPFADHSHWLDCRVSRMPCQGSGDCRRRGDARQSRGTGRTEELCLCSRKSNNIFIGSVHTDCVARKQLEKDRQKYTERTKKEKKFFFLEKFKTVNSL